MPTRLPFNKKLIHTVFEDQVLQRPEQIAVEQGTRRITYAELDRRADVLADGLLACLPQRGAIVGVALEPGIELVTALLAIFKAGHIYLPIDSGFPEARLRRISAKTPPALLVTDAALRERLAAVLAEEPAVPRFLALLEADGQPVVEARAGQLPSPAAAFEPPDGDDGNYLFYTSGSTGEPKAILGQHKSLGHFIQWEAGEFGIDHTFRIAQLTQITFDASLRDIFGALANGGTLCVPETEDRHNMNRLANWLESSGVHLIHTVPSLLRALTRELGESGRDDRLPALRFAIMSGEMLFARDLHAWRKVNRSAELVNFYGATETTMIRMFHRIAEIPANPAEPIPAGVPISKTLAFVVVGDRLAARGEVGEIFIKTPFLTKGYYNDPERTAEIFVQNPLNPQPDLVYRSGDRGRVIAGGLIEVLGREDGLVKINGARVELAEVQRAVLSLPAIGEALVTTRQDLDRNNLLVCYFTSAQTLTSQELREHCRRFLPDLMVPAFFVQLERFPLNANGKIDKAALPNPEDLIYAHRPFTAPRTATETTLAAIWGTVLGHAKVGIKHNFFEIGGHSLTSTMIISRVYQTFGVNLKLHQFFEFPTVEGQAALIDRSQRDDYRTISPAEAAKHYPLSHAQQRLWVLRQIDEDGAAYNMPGAYLLEGPLRPELLAQALEQLLARHEILRTRFIEVDEQPCQEILQSVPFALVQVDLSREAEPEAFAQSLALAEARLSFRLDRPPLLRAQLLALAAERHVLLLTLHHIVCDGWSLRLILDEIAQVYESLAAGTEPALPPLAIQYKDFAVWQRQRLDSGALESERAYWLERLAGPPAVLDLPSDRSRPKLQSFRGETRHYRLPLALSQELERFCKQRSSTLFNGLYALVTALCQRLSGQTDIVIGTPIAGRVLPELEPQVGCYLNLLPLRSEVAPAGGFAALFEHSAKRVLEAFDHQNYPFDRMVDDLNLARDLSRAPLFDVVLVLHNTRSVGTGPSGLNVADFGRREGISRYDLTFHFRQSGHDLELALEYNVDLFESARIDDLFRALCRLGEQALAAPACPLRELELVDEDQRRQILEAFNQPAPASAVLPLELFAAQVAERADQPALTCQGRTISYGALDRRVAALADLLIARHQVGPGQVVALMLNRTEWAVAAMLAVLETGAAYLPLDPGYPVERIGQMVRDSGAKLLLGEREFVDEALRRPALFGGIQAIEPMALHFLVEPPPRLRPRRALDPALPAYLIYTSGSSGQPKGVQVSHGALAAFARDFAPLLNCRPGLTMLALTTVSFDISILELLLAPVLGLRAVIADEEQCLDGAELIALMRRESVRVLQTTPTRLNLLLEERGEALLDELETLVIGGEALPESLHQRLVPLLGRLNVLNAYGPSESTIWSTVRQVDAAHRDIGRPLAGENAYVLSPAARLLPAGCPGELAIGGQGLAIGYLGRARETASRFVPHPFADGQRLYLTGDRAMWRHDGALTYMGRLDFQVKLRGVRIEPEEIERQLTAHPAVDQALVVVRELGGEPTLCAYLIQREAVEPAELQRFLGRNLPRFMVPAHFVVLERFPQTANGKTDRRALPAPNLEHVDRACAPARDPLEHQLLELWGELLGQTRLGIHDTFFDLGGDSVKLIRLFRRLGQLWPERLRISDLFALTTVAQLADHLRAEPLAAHAPTIVEIEI